ncbi:MAG: hypothetical protein KDA88_18035 [Planctomycetaceae bacterium]|nr:hypothetical protein [Planctomycetaceae bacterium]MCA9032945.1 hypothetical protein [Planctomycetaceae bacterium]MCB9951025.1 hypothetical protein [Planctomycetaceae bacterium]
MSEHTASEHATAEAQNLFTQAELKQFEADDAEAGQAIGKMLSMFFFYTVIVMIISTIATIWWINK